MSSVNVSLDALENLRGALMRFSAEARESLDMAEQEVRKTLEWLAERQKYWQRESERRAADVQAASAALTRCRAAAYRDPKTGQVYVPDCSGHERALAVAIGRLKEAREELASAQRWTRSVEEAASEYRKQANGLATALAADVPKATGFLGTRVESLRGYRSTSFAGSAPRGNMGAPPGYLMPDGPHSATSARSDIRDVSLADIDVSDSHVGSRDDFQKVSYDEMAEGFRKLEEVVRPAVRHGADGDYFSSLDAQRGLEYPNGYRRVYDAFYGGDAIVLEQTGDGYIVINGYHRLYVARELEIHSVPARLLTTP